MVSRRTGGGEESLEAKAGQENELDSPPPACTLQIRSGRAIFPLPPAALCREPPTQGHFCFKFLHSVTNRILSPVLVMLTSPNTGVFYRSLSLSKMAISDNLKTCKPETGCNSSVQRVAADMTFRNPEGHVCGNALYVSRTGIGLELLHAGLKYRSETALSFLKATDREGPKTVTGEGERTNWTLFKHLECDWI